GGLNGVDSCIERRVIIGDFAHHLDAGTEGKDLAALPGMQASDGGFGHLLGLIQAAARAHAQRIVEGKHRDFTRSRAWQHLLKDIRLRKGQNNEGDQQSAKSKQHEITQTAVLDRALDVLLEEHERTEGRGGAAMFAQQVQPDGQPNADQTREKPGRQKTHYILPWRMNRYSRRPSSSGRAVFMRK